MGIILLFMCIALSIYTIIDYKLDCRYRIIKQKLQTINDKALLCLATPRELVNRHHISCYYRAINRFEKIIKKNKQLTKWITNDKLHRK